MSEECWNDGSLKKSNISWLLNTKKTTKIHRLRTYIYIEYDYIGLNRDVNRSKYIVLKLRFVTCERNQYDEIH